MLIFIVCVFFFFAWVFYPREYKRDVRDIQRMNQDVSKTQQEYIPIFSYFLKDMENFDDDLKALFRTGEVKK